MPKFNLFSPLLKNLVLAVSVLALSSCVSDEPTEKGENQATFQINEVELVNVSNAALSSGGIVNKKIFEFKACIKDLVQFKTVIDGQFYVVDKQGERTAHKTDTNGCFTWGETIQFELGLQSRWILIERTIVAGGLHRGSVEIPLAINPWLPSGSQFPAAVDYRYRSEAIPADKVAKTNDENATLMGVDKSGHLSRSQLWVQDVTLTVREGSYGFEENGEMQPGAELMMDLQFEPKVRVRDVLGDITTTKLFRGKLLVKPFIIATQPTIGSQDKAQINEDIAPIEIDFRDSFVREEFSVRIPYFPNAGNIELGLRVVSLESGLLPFEGIYYLGTWNNIIGRKVGQLRSNVVESYDKALADLEANRVQVLNQPQILEPFLTKTDPKELANVDGFGRVTYQQSRGKIDFTAVSKAACENAVYREVQYQVLSCIYHPITLKAVPNTELKVSEIMPNGTKRLIETDTTRSDGCIIWEDSLRHNYYQRERYVIREIMLENEKFGIKQSLGVAINPWDYGFTFGRDASQVENLVTEPSKNSPNPHLVLHNFGVNYLEQNYIMDDMLGLNMKRRYRYQFAPRVLRHDSLKAGINQKDDLRDGVYLVRFVLAKHWQESANGQNGMARHTEQDAQIERLGEDRLSNVTPEATDLPEYITHFETPALVKDGRVTVEVDFTMRDLFLIGSRNSVIVEVLPADPDGLVFKDPRTSGDDVSCEIDAGKSTFVPLDEKKSGLRIATYEAPQVLYDLGGGTIFQRVAYRATDIIKQAEDSRLAEGWREFQEMSNNPQNSERDEKIINYAFQEALKVVNLSDDQMAQKMAADFNIDAQQLTDFQERRAFGASPREKAEFSRRYYEGLEDRDQRRRFLESQANIRRAQNASAYSKIRQKLFMPIEPQDLRNIVLTGIYPENISEPAVDNFAHLACGFWFNSFYKDYMSQTQIEAIKAALKNKKFLKPVEHWLQVNGDVFTQPLTPMDPFERPGYHGNEGPTTRGYIHDVWRELLRLKHPYLKCLENPYKFFAFQKKIIVHDVASDHPGTIRYLGGASQNYNVNESVRIDTNRGWDLSKSYSFSMGGSLVAGDAGFLRLGAPLLSFAGIKVGGDWSTSRGLKEGWYRGHGISLSKGPWLVVNKSDFLIELARYQHCLVMRPQHGVFSEYEELWKDQLEGKDADQLPYKRAGLMMCLDPMDKELNGQPMRIRESYYFAFQHFAGGSVLHDPNNIGNRPFLIFLRGADEFDKFLEMVHGSVEPEYQNLNSKPVDMTEEAIDPLLGTVRAFKTLNALDRTGFYPGIYTVTGPPMDAAFEREKNVFDSVFKFIADHHFLPWIEFEDGAAFD